ncbi:hypothetical protein SAMN05192549_103227 [Duganella sacchari]|uniref:Uncharacterized protein n=1 Tax=Duganella sacchari TaxID=551987 RepID=A0A1M7MLF2_9BURK|nr:hypothetical protein [Duganella sacchari]SHM91823.1 hypothetical protein SAMN05192549_103227 [Duganella sacchari]
MRYLSLIMLLVLSACGGSSHDWSAPDTPTTPQPPVAMVDAFVTAVLAVIGDGSETSAEPQATDQVAVTTPDDTEPVAVK